MSTAALTLLRHEIGRLTIAAAECEQQAVALEQSAHSLRATAVTYRRQAKELGAFVAGLEGAPDR